MDSKMKEAFAQMEEKQYYREFENEGKQIILIGIVFASEYVEAASPEGEKEKVKFKVEFRVH
jgi:hypothetical protein